MAIDESGLQTPRCGRRQDIARSKCSNEKPPLPAFLRIRDVVRITALSRPTLYRRIADHRFPPPVHLGGRACGWPSEAVQTWISDPEGYRVPLGPEVSPPRKRGRPRKYPV